MRTRFLASAVAFASATVAVGVAGAADLAVKATKAPTMEPIALYNWTGCYIGGHIGGAFSDDTSTNPLGDSSSHNSSGVVGGGQIGCGYQFAPGWVLGAEVRARGPA